MNSGLTPPPLEDIWENICEDIESRFHLSPNYDIMLEIKGEGSSEPSDIWLTHVDGTRLRVNAKAYHKEPDMVMAVLTREAMFTARPSCFHEDVWFDIAAEVGRQTLVGSRFAKRYELMWAQFRKEELIEGAVVYNPVKLFVALYELANSAGIEGLVRRIRQAAQHNVPFSRTAAIRYVRSFVMEYVVPLSSLEAMITEILLRNPTTPGKEIARRVRTTETWVSNTVVRLRRRGVLRLFERVSLQSVGIKICRLVLSSPEPSLCYNLIKDYPFLYSWDRVVVGRPGIVATVCIPNQRENITSIRTLGRIASAAGIEFQSFEAWKVGCATSFQGYNPEIRQWDIDWKLLRFQAEHIHRQGIEFPFPYQTADEHEQPLDDVDAAILVAFSQGNTTVRAIRQVVRKRQQEVARRLSALRKSGVIRLIAEVHHVGLDETAIVTSDNPATARVLEAIAQSLPYAYVHLDPGGALFMRTCLPRGGSAALGRALSAVREPPEIRATVSDGLGAWSLSRFIHLWNPASMRWRKYDRLDEWATNLRSRIQ